MPLTDEVLSRETDGSFNEDYCQWCYKDGNFVYHDIETLMDVCVQHMCSPDFPEAAARAYLKDRLPKLSYWRKKA